jgi:acylphosphatase
MAAVGRHILITGRVQGVFFRQWTADTADRLGVSGWVRNRPDGSVEAHLEGESEAVRQMIERMRSGPPGASVTGLSEEGAEPADASGFEVRG